MTYTEGEAREEFAKGWRILVAAAIGAACGGAVGFPSLGFFIPALQAGMGWSRAQAGGAASAIMIGLLLGVPIAGRLCDRYGVRRVIVPAILATASAFLVLGLATNNLIAFYAGYFVSGVAGAGTSFVIYARNVSLRFNRSRGLSLGLMMSVAGLSIAISPVIASKFIKTFGWQSGYLWLAAFALIPMPFVLMWLRDGEAVSASSMECKPLVEGMTFREVLRTRQFWLMAVAIFLISAAVLGTSVHTVPMYTDMGARAATLQWAAVAGGLTLFVARPVIGVLLDRLNPRLVAAISSLIPVAALLFVPTLGPAFAVLFAIGISLGQSAENDLIGYLTSRYFGMRAFAETYGWLYAIGLLGFAIGPLLAGMARDFSGDYRLFLTTAAIACGVGSLCFVLLGEIPSREASERAYAKNRAFGQP
ncbi:MFS transporter [Burkholderia anthina]|uniref:MFS transporter n=1 Tax=Burkholderia anthina TaxID=179879 RepID=UPI00158F49DF|nr:MFS transporter [Burkholderia anthina]